MAARPSACKKLQATGTMETTASARTVRYLGVDVEDALLLAERTEI